MSLSGNTEKINELLSKINALPEAGSGGGSGGGVETCTVTVTAVSESPQDLTVYVTYVDADSGTSFVETLTAPMLDATTKTISVAKNSLIIMDMGGLFLTTGASLSIDNMQIVRSVLDAQGGSTRGIVFQVTGDGATLEYTG